MHRSLVLASERHRVSAEHRILPYPGQGVSRGRAGDPRGRATKSRCRPGAIPGQPMASTSCPHSSRPPDSPLMQASCSGEAVYSGGLTLAPWESKSFTHSMLPEAQASQSGVLPSMFRASTSWAGRDKCHGVEGTARFLVLMHVGHSSVFLSSQVS